MSRTEKIERRGRPRKLNSLAYLETRLRTIELDIAAAEERLKTKTTQAQAAARKIIVEAQADLDLLRADYTALVNKRYTLQQSQANKEEALKLVAELLLPVVEAANLLGVSVDTVHNNIRDGVFTDVVIAGGQYVLKSQVQAQVAAR